MSFSFYVRCHRPPTLSEVVYALNEPLFECPESPPSGGDWAAGFRYRPFARGRAARGVELAHEGGAFAVRLLTCSSRADYELGMSLVRTLAYLARAHVAPERLDAPPLSSMDLARAYGDAWIDAMVAAGPATVVKAMEEKKGTVSLSCPRRPFHFGTRMLAELRARTTKESFGTALVEAMVALQSVDEAVYYPALPMLLVPEGHGETEPRDVTVWEPGVAYIFPEVQYFALTLPDDQLAYIPAAMGPKIGGARWRFLDETTALVEATPANEWEALLRRAGLAAKKPAPLRVAHEPSLLDLDDL